MTSFVIPVTNLVLAADPGGGLMRPFIGLGLKILAFMATVAFAREAYRLVTGQQTNFVDVAVRWVLAALLVAGVPYLATWMQGALQEAGNALFQIGNTRLLEGSYEKAMTQFKCNDLDWMDIIALFAMPSGWLMLMAQLCSLLAQLGKLIVIDILWPIVLNLTIIAGALTVPIGFLEELGGLKVYIKNVASVASWPLMFAILTVGMAAGFQKTLTAVEAGKIKPNCEQLDTSAASDIPAMLLSEVGLSDNRVARITNGEQAGILSNVSYSEGADTSMKGMLHFIAICLAHLFLMLSIPKAAATLFGGSGAGEALSAAVTGGASRRGKGRSADRAPPNTKGKG